MLTPSDLAPGLHLGEDVTLGQDVTIGAHVTIHAGTRVGDRCVIEDGAVLGKVPRLGRRSTAARKAPEPLELAEEVTVCAGAVVFAGARVGARAVLGEQCQVRKRSTIGADSVVGRGSTVDNDVTIGERTKLQTLVYLTAYSTVEDDVFLAPCVVTTNDDTMGRHGPEYALRGPTVRRAARVGGGAVLRPGVEIGEEAFVAAGGVGIPHRPPPRGGVRGPPRGVRGG